MSSTPPLLRAEIFRYSLKVGYLGGRPVAKRDRFRFFSFEKNHTRSRRGFLVRFEIRSKQDERYDAWNFLIFRMKKTMQAWRAIEFYHPQDDSHVILRCRVTFCMMIVSLAGKWLFVTIIRMETVENDFDIPRRCYLTLSLLGDECVTQHAWNDVSFDTDTPTLFHD